MILQFLNRILSENLMSAEPIPLTPPLNSSGGAVTTPLMKNPLLQFLILYPPMAACEYELLTPLGGEDYRVGVSSGDSPN